MLRGAGALLGFAVGACCVATPARADRIDGTWCHAQSHFTIDGSRLSLGPVTLDGTYTRHSFAYRVPTGQPDAGSEITMVLRGEDDLQLNRPGGVAQEAWRRCRVTS